MEEGLEGRVKVVRFSYAYREPTDGFWEGK